MSTTREQSRSDTNVRARAQRVAGKYRGDPRLELGAGYAHTAGFVSLDINPNTKPDWVGPVDVLPWADGTFVELRAVDILEHVSYRDTDRVLSEWARVTKPDGRLYIQSPDAHRAIERYNEHGDLYWLTEVLLGGHADDRFVRRRDDWRLNAHYALFSELTLTRALVKAGWSVESCVTNAHPNLCVWAVRT